MRDMRSYTIHALFGIVAVNGTLLLLPGDAFAASAHEPAGEGGVLATDAALEVASSLDCALLESTAASQEPGGEGGEGGEGDPECKNKDGSPRECTPSENLAHCGADARDAVGQCNDAAKTTMARVFCELGYAADAAKCWKGFLEELGVPLPEGTSGE